MGGDRFCRFISSVPHTFRPIFRPIGDRFLGPKAGFIKSVSGGFGPINFVRDLAGRLSPLYNSLGGPLRNRLGPRPNPHRKWTEAQKFPRQGQRPSKGGGADFINSTPGPTNRPATAPEADPALPPARLALERQYCKTLRKSKRIAQICEGAGFGGFGGGKMKN